MKRKIGVTERPRSLNPGKAIAMVPYHCTGSPHICLEYEYTWSTSAKSGTEIEEVWDGRENSQILGGVDRTPRMPYMGYIGMCGPKGYGFLAF